MGKVCMFSPHKVHHSHDCPELHGGRLLEFPKYYLNGKSCFACEIHVAWYVEQWPTSHLATRTGVFHSVIGKKKKNRAAVALGRLGGLKGGKARAKKLTPERRSEIAREAAKKRWARRTT